ncbi:hypothetical protein N806_13595 [Rhodococcus sp. P27]|nr:hypothetical protein N806_13595 [Rhodococcus sp. P27]
MTSEEASSNWIRLPVGRTRIGISWLEPTVSILS